MKEAGIQVESLSLFYPGNPRPALQGVNLTVYQGEIAFLVGGNLSGKTSLLRCLGGLIPGVLPGKWRGRILVANKSLNAEGNERAPAGVILQNSDLYLLPRVYDELALPLVNSGLTSREVEKRIVLLAEELGICHLLNRQMSSLSGGERQKVAFAAAIAVDYPVILCDEPFEQADAEAAEAMLSLLRRKAASGGTVLIATRYFEYARYFADRIILIRDGAVIAQDRSGNAEKIAGMVPECRISRRQRSQATIMTVSGSRELFFEGVTHLFDSGHGIKNVSLEVCKGEVVAIMGPNGSGKTTLLKHTVGLLRPQKGRVWLRETETSRLPVGLLAQKIGMLFQNPDDQIFNERVDHEIACSLRARGARWNEALKEAAHWLAKIGQAQIAASHPHSLPYSLRQIVSLVSVLINRPEIIVLDEPFKSLDYRNVEILMSIILELRQEKDNPIILVTHDPTVTLLYANRVAFFDHGEIVLQGVPQDIFFSTQFRNLSLSRHPFIRGLLNSNNH